MANIYPLVVYNNLTRSKTPFKTLVEGEVKFYSCGPTTYDFLHVGNARALVVGDLIHRVFKVLGYKVNFTRNFTDVDDKIIQKAQEVGADPLEYAQRFVKECQQDMLALGMLPATHTPKVSETMQEIIAMIEVLVEKKMAYVHEGEVLYYVPGFKEYGKLSKRDLEGLQHGKRVEVEQHKKHPSDFVLWKPAKENESAVWDSPWGKGRPGWHIECSAMAKKFLGDTIDIHHGGVDLMFPHHENEIAQSEAANGVEFSKHWCHNEFLNFGQEKMSKSLGNVITIRDFCQKFSGLVLRQILCNAHYRSKMDWSNEVVDKAMADVERIHQFVLHVEKNKGQKGSQSEGLEQFSSAVEEMKKELAQDFNMPGAMAHFFSAIRLYNRHYKDAAPSAQVLATITELIEFTHQATGLVDYDAQKVLDDLQQARANLHGQKHQASDVKKIEELVEKRKNARAQKNWKEADLARDELKALGIEVKDNPDGSVSWTYK